MKFKKLNEDTNKSTIEQDILAIEDINEFLKVVNIETHKEPSMVGPMYLLKDGSFIYVNDYVSKNKYDSENNRTHTGFIGLMMDEYIENKYNFNPNNIYLSPHTIRGILEENGLIRLNTGTTASDNRFYMCLPSGSYAKPTNAQYNSLLKFLDLNTKEVWVYIGNKWDAVSQKYVDYIPEDVIKKIKRYYASGNLYESLNEETIYRGEGNTTLIPRYLSQYTGRFYGLTEEDVKYYGAPSKYDLNSKKIYKARTSEDACNELRINDWNCSKLGEFTSKYINDNNNEEESDFYYFDQNCGHSIFNTLSQWYNCYEEYFGEQYDEDIELICFSEWCRQIVLRYYLQNKYDGIYYKEEDGFPQYQIWNQEVITKMNESLLNEVYPNKGESKKDFTKRFMSVTKDEYPDVKQRYAVCMSYWNRRNKKRKNESLDADIITLYTIQDEKVLDKLNKGETYIADYNNIFDKDYIDLYKKLSSLYNFKNCPIFCVDEDSMHVIGSSGIIEGGDKILLKLNVPISEVKYHDYYDWTDYLFFSVDDDGTFENEEDQNNYVLELEDNIKNQKCDNTEDREFVIDRIEPSWLNRDTLQERTNINYSQLTKPTVMYPDNRYWFGITIKQDKDKPNKIKRNKFAIQLQTDDIDIVKEILEEIIPKEDYDRMRILGHTSNLSELRKDGYKLLSLGESLNEGAWSTPNIVTKAKELQKLLSKPLTIKEATHKLYNLIGDDELFDRLYNFEKKNNSDSDCRDVVIEFIKDTLLEKQNEYTVKFDKEAIKILQEIVNINQSTTSNNINESLNEDYDTFKNSLHFPLFIMRGIYVRSKKDIDLKNIGKSWTVNPNLFISTDATLGNYIPANECNYILSGYVNEDDIDWKETEERFYQFSDKYYIDEDDFDYDTELEIVLKNNVIPNNLKIESRKQFFSESLNEGDNTLAPHTIRSLMFKTEDSIEASPFTDFIEEGLSKLDENIYIYFWHDSKSHDTMLIELGNKYNIIEERTFTIYMNSEGTINEVNIDKAFEGEFAPYKEKVIAKAKNYLRTTR